jgi:hypothetical protein
MKFSPLPCYLVPLRPKYSPQHPILKHHHPTFLAQCQRPCFTPTENKRQNFSSQVDTMQNQEEERQSAVQHLTFPLLCVYEQAYIVQRTTNTG